MFVDYRNIWKDLWKGAPDDKETWWWCDEVSECIKNKKKAKKKYYAEINQTNREALRRANKAAKKAVAVARAKARESIYDELETIEGQTKMYRIKCKYFMLWIKRKEMLAIK